MTDKHAGWWSQLLACGHLLRISIGRMVRSRQSMVSLLLLSFAVLAVVAWSLRRGRSPAQFIEQVFLTLEVTLLLPVFSLCYGTAAIAPDREERTLVYLLVTPLPRALLFAAKAAAAVIVTLAWTMGSTLLLCAVAGAPGRAAWGTIWPSILVSTVAHTALFLLFSVLFRRATVLALAYALFVETLVGNLPGIAKRASLSYYTKCAIFDASADFSLRLDGPLRPELFLPISGTTSLMVLGIASSVLLLVGTLLFATRE